jgi:hypothetical protein
MTQDYIKTCVGYRRIDTIKRQFSNLYQPTVQFDNTPADAVLTPGHLATLKKKPRNTVPVPRPFQFADVMHISFSVRMLLLEIFTTAFYLQIVLAE